MDKFSQVGNQEITAIEELYSSYLTNRDSVDVSWKNFFAGFDLRWMIGRASAVEHWVKRLYVRCRANS